MVRKINGRNRTLLALHLPGYVGELNRLREKAFEHCVFLLAHSINDQRAGSLQVMNAIRTKDVQKAAGVQHFGGQLLAFKP